MMSKTPLLAIALTIGIYAIYGPNSVRAQQTFLPPMFQVGAKLLLQGDNNRVFTVVAQQGAWVRVIAAASPGTDEPETWIYAPNGTIWAKAR